MKQHHMILGLLGAFGLIACSDAGGVKSHSVPWEGEHTDIITSDGSVRTLETPQGDDCLALDSDECVKPQDECDGRGADVVLDEEGEVLDVVCYPEGETLTVETIEASNGDIAQNQNDAAIVLDGAEIEGDVSVDANNVVIYGDGPDSARISGDVTVDGNNIVVRGVRIAGNVHIIANDSIFLHCVIEGDVTITGNNTLLSACDVLGRVSIEGNNTRLSGNRVVGGVEDGGKNTECEENVSATDTDGDGQLEEGELGGAIDCR